MVKKNGKNKNIQINGRPWQSSVYQLEDLKTSNRDEWLVGCNDEDNSRHVPATNWSNKRKHELVMS